LKALELLRQDFSEISDLPTALPMTRLSIEKIENLSGAIYLSIGLISQVNYKSKPTCPLGGEIRCCNVSGLRRLRVNGVSKLLHCPQLN
jgi:hypothetical protein